MTTEQKAYLACTIYQSRKDGKVSIEQPEDEFFYIKTPIHGPNIDGMETRPSDVPNGEDGSTLADFWFQEYTDGVLQSRNGYGYGEPVFPNHPGDLTYSIYQGFVNPSK